MTVEIKFIPYGPYEGEKVSPSIAHLGQAHSKEECLKLIGEAEPEQKGVYEYIVHSHKTVIYASNTDKVAIEKVLEKIFK